MSRLSHTIEFRICYAEVDPTGSYYNSRALEWFERGRGELCRAMGMSYGEMESAGVALPVIEAHVEFTGRAGYDTLARMTIRVSRQGKARLRFDVRIEQAETGNPVCNGWTVHAVTNRQGRPIRPPDWLLDFVRE